MDIDLGLLECRFGVLDQLLAEHGQDGGESLDEGDADGVGELGVPGAEILFEEVMHFTAQLDSSGTTTDDDL